MIKILALNPSVDKYFEVNNLRIGELNRTENKKISVGGKGINVAKYINILKGKCIVYGFIGGYNGELIDDYCMQNGIRTNFYKIKEQNRENIKLIDKSTKILTEINEAGPNVTYQEFEQLKKDILSDFTENDILICTGSIPKNLDNSVYSDFIASINNIGGKAILDAEGDLLKNGIKSLPYLIKPNLFELESIFYKKVDNINDLVNYSKKFLDDGIKKVVISLGEKGSFFAESNEYLYVKPINVDIKNQVGAGDSMVAALAFALENNLKFADKIKLAVALATLSVSYEKTEDIDVKKIDDFIKLVNIHKI